MGEEAKLEKVVIGEACSGKKAKGMAGKPAEGISYVTHESSWSFQQTPVMKTGLPREDL